MIECLDESHANCAFKECMELQEMGTHHLICDICEYFVHWDKDLSSMFFCVSTTYYPHGDLGSYVTQQHQRSQTLDESTIRIWIGETVQALVFALKKNISHRNLKPSNVYLRDSGNHIVIGDFCVPSVLTDMYTHTRSVVGSRYFCAPECAELTTTDDKADVWALGCVTLYMMTCGVRGADGIVPKLDDIKYSRSALDDILVLTEEYFSETLQSFVRQTLTIDPKRRPSLMEIAEQQFIIDSIEEANISRIADQQLEYPYKPLPTSDSVMNFMKYLVDNLGNELCVGDAIEHLLKVSKESTASSPLVIDASKKKIVLKALSIHIAIGRVAAAGLQLMVTQLTINPDPNDYLFSPEAIECCITAMRKHPLLAEVQKSGNVWLMAASTNEVAVEVMIANKVYVDILQTMQNSMDDPVVCTRCMDTLWGLMATGGNIRFLAEQKAINVVVDIIKKHDADTDLLQSAFCLILGLTLQDENIKLIKSAGCVDLIMEALNGFSSVQLLVKYGCLALAAIVEADEESAYYMLTEQMSQNTNAVKTIMEIYSYHRQNPIVVSSICTLLVELSHYEDIASEMENMKVEERVLKPVRKKFKDEPDILAKCNKVLSNISSVRPLIPLPKTLLPVS